MTSNLISMKLPVEQTNLLLAVLTKAIQDKRTLRDQLVGTLYPDIVTGELIELNALHAIISRALCESKQ